MIIIDIQVKCLWGHFVFAPFVVFLIFIFYGSPLYSDGYILWYFEFESDCRDESFAIDGFGGSEEPSNAFRSNGLACVRVLGEIHWHFVFDSLAEFLAQPIKVDGKCIWFVRDESYFQIYCGDFAFLGVWVAAEVIRKMLSVFWESCWEVFWFLEALFGPFDVRVLLTRVNG
jgi:hypothetical protein